MIEDVAGLESLDDLQLAFRRCTTHESAVDAALDELLAQQATLHSLLDKVDHIQPVVAHVQYEAQELHLRIDNTAQVAERISGQVRSLDEEQSRVQASIDMLQAVQDLKVR
jgi:chromosome segregation ATPase